MAAPTRVPHGACGQGVGAVIWPLVLLWVCVAGLAVLLFGAVLRVTTDEQDVLAAQREREGLGRCVRRAQQYETGPGGNRGSARTSTGVPSRAARRS